MEKDLERAKGKIDTIETQCDGRRLRHKQINLIPIVINMVLLFAE